MPPSHPLLRAAAEPGRRPPVDGRRRRLGRRIAVGAVGAVAGVLPLSTLTVLVVSPPAEASSTYLCTGYTGCERAGYSHAGYAPVNQRMYWRMYGGHNCTNYVAYRMIRAGMSTERPWSGTGMAYNWGLANSRITNQTPKVGAVAWWNRGVGGMSSSGHVAYVERVVSSTEIVISEDSWGGDFSWRRITKDGRGWPSGFIHFPTNGTPTPPTPPPSPPPAPRALANTAPPTVPAETPVVGEMVVAEVGTWSGGPTGYIYQWKADGAPIAGATFRGFTPTDAQIGKALTLDVTATRSGYTSATASAAATPAVARAGYDITAPTVISGTPQMGQTLTATPGAFSPAPETATVQWRSNGTVIPGVRGEQLTLGPEQIGTSITALTIARGTGRAKATSTSAPAGPVAPGAIELATPYAVAGRPRLGETLTIQPGTTTPDGVAFYYRWLRDGVPIAGGHLGTHTLTVDDVGHDLSAQVTLRKTSYADRVETVPVGTVRTPAQVVVKPTSRVRRAKVVVRVLGEGAVNPPGEVIVRIGGTKVTAPLRAGRAVVLLTRLKPGSRTVVARFTGSEVVEPGTGRAPVEIKR